VFFATAFSFNAFASGVKQISYENLEPDLSHICIVTVSQVDKEPNYKTFLYGRTVQLSVTITVTGEIQSSHKGECGTGQFSSQYTTPVYSEYDDWGNRIGGYWLLGTGTGLELTVLPGETYAFSYMLYEQGSKTLQHVRVDHIQNLLN